MKLLLQLRLVVTFFCFSTFSLALHFKVFKLLSGAYFLVNRNTNNSLSGERTNIVNGSIVDDIAKYQTMWRWQLPAKMRQTTSNVTKTIGVVKLLGAIRTQASARTKGYQNFGFATLAVDINGQKTNISCNYMANIGSSLHHVINSHIRDDPLGSLGLAVECNIPQSPEGEKLYSLLLKSEGGVKVVVSIFTAKFAHYLQDSYLLPQSRANTPLQLPQTSRFLPEFRSLPSHVHTTIRVDRPTVLTVQTFRNLITGPSLYMFVVYYLNLGYGVIIYDMYGLHQSYLQEFIDREEIDYHSYTVLENIFTNIFNAERHKRVHNDTKVKYWYYVNSSSNLTVDIEKVDINEASNQRDNKRYTIDGAILNYSHITSSILYVDRDELLFCPDGGYNVKSQRQYQSNFIRRWLFEHNNDQIFIPRFDYLSVVDSSNSAPGAANIEEVLEKCLLTAYARRSIFAYFNCFSAVTAYRSSDKCLFRSTSCPLHSLHFSCVRCACNNVTISKPPNVQECHFIHLSNPLHTSVEVKTPRTKPHSSLVEMWSQISPSF